MMLGFADPWIALAYLLCVGVALLCVGWGLWRRNRTVEDEPESEIRHWAQEEDRVEDEL